MADAASTRELSELFDGLTHAGALTELAVLVGCLVLSWAIVSLMRRALDVDGSVLFGRRAIDGVLFPVLALALALLAREALRGVVKVALFKLAIPILLSLVLIRLTVRVLSAALPESRWVRFIERTVSWLAWIAVAIEGFNEASKIWVGEIGRAHV